ncbi:MAG: hypothetical protein ACTHK2_06915 [Dokdonella sp.]|uniref:hypothetical protein n=1 Tax=Dokdonella sp. TaxID=2291710 RepID=UPI003F7DB556
MALSLAFAGFAACARASQPATENPHAGDLAGLHDFDFVIGDWRVHHRLINAKTKQWIEFEGTMSTRKIMEGYGNLEDNVLDRPGGRYRAAAMRTYDPKTATWAIWWFDGRTPHGAVDPPVKGRFENGIGRFYSDDVVDGKPLRTRYQWSHDGAERAHWEQATSSDGGATWETSWLMDFTRR